MNLETLATDVFAALLNSTCQALLLPGTIWLALKCAGRTNATTRHAVWFLTFLLLAVLPLLHFLVPTTIPQAQGQSHSALTGTQVGPLEETPLILLGRESERLEVEASDWALRSNEPISSESSLPVSVGSAPTAPLARTGNFLAEVLSSTSEFVLAGPNSLALSLGKGMAMTLVATWLGLATLRVVRLMREVVYLRRLKQLSTPAEPPVERLCEQIGRELRLARSVSVLTCPAVTIPIAVGFRRPAVLLPPALSLEAETPGLDVILRHEIAHLCRRDDWTNLLQQMVGAVYFFNPAIWWVAQRLEIEREIACDDHVLAASRKPRAYALLLTDLANRKQSRDWAAAPAAWKSKSQLKERISMILDSKRNTSTRLGGIRVGLLTSAAALIAATVVQTAPRVVLADETPEASARATAGAAKLELAPELSATVHLEPKVETSVEFSRSPQVEVTIDPVPVPEISFTSGPRSKSSLELTAPAALPVPGVVPPIAPIAAPAAPPALASVPAPPAVVAVPGYAHPVPGEWVHPPQPAQTRPGHSTRSRGGDGGEDFEHRLERLERMVESLANREKAGNHYKLKGAPEKPVMEFDPNVMSHQEAHKLHMEASRQAEKASREAQRALQEIERQANRQAQEVNRDLERNMKDLERSLGELQKQNTLGPKKEKDHINYRRQALEQARKSLATQLQEIEKQLESLEEVEARKEQQKAEKGEQSKPEDQENPKENPKR